MIHELIILGTSGNASDVLDIVEAINAVSRKWKVLGFLDDATPAGGTQMGHAVLGALADAGRFGRARFINAIGSDRSFRARQRIIASTGVALERFATLVHPQAAVSSRARLGAGVYVGPGACIAGNVTIGEHVSIAPGCIIGHDSVVEACSVLAPGAVVSGGVRVEAGCYLGARCAIRQCLRIGAGALVGMGAVVVRNVAREDVVAGNPARSLQSVRTIAMPVQGLAVGTA